MHDPDQHPSSHASLLTLIYHSVPIPPHPTPSHSIQFHHLQLPALAHGLWLISGTLRIKRQHLGIDTLTEAIVRFDPGAGEEGEGEEEEEEDDDVSDAEEGEEEAEGDGEGDESGPVDPDDLVTAEERGPAALNEIMTKLLLPSAKEVNRLEYGQGYGASWW